MATLPPRVDVLVAGFGPVGAALACLLGRYGVQALVIDRARDILPMPRAIALDNEALRILQMAGLNDEAFARYVIPHVRYVSPFVGEFGRINTSGTIDCHPKLVTFFQPQLEEALRDCVAGHGSVQVATGVELLDFVDSGATVRARLRLESGDTAEMECRFLVGADGASSSIRRAIGQEFAGQTYAEEWLIVDAERPQQKLDHIVFHCDPRRPTPHMPGPGKRERWEFMLHPGESRERMEQEDTVRALLAPHTPEPDMRVTRKAVYRFHARSCARFSVGRVFLVGDAAHVTPPFAGQGLVAGLRDAANLGWKLAWVLRGLAAEPVLESYDTERRPHAKAMIDLARFLGHLIMPRSRIKAWLVHGTMRVVRLLPWLRAYFDELHIKPKNRFARGLFVPGARSLGGTWLPQVMLRAADGSLRRSDDVLGDGFALVACGVRAADTLDAATLAAWTRAGGRVVTVHPQGVECGGDDYEDLDGTLVPGTAPPGWVVLVRPDRAILHAGLAAEAGRLVRESLAMLGVANAR